MSKKASFKKSFGLLLLSVVLIMAFRWILFEPFVIPSGSMIPTLMVNDHIVVSKYSYGVRLPFSSKWLTPPQLPQRGDVVVFRSVEKDDYYMIKRVVGLPGDKVQFTESGELLINGKTVPSAKPEIHSSLTAEDIGDSPDNFDIKEEALGEHKHQILIEHNAFRYTESGRVVPEGKIYLMGDNRDRSRDSRFWGELPIASLLGKARWIWLSCSQTLAGGNFVCDPRYIRWQRVFHRIE
ncbi:MAG: signal peptidase I [Bdellovibrionales bacterium RBG_16_40_8]|nr:MAG: signal peptidase I [Bdellovibrionales bacterium RBG_16_40_8]